MAVKKKVDPTIIRIPRTNVLMILRILLIQLMSVGSLLFVGSAIVVISESFGLGAFLGILLLIVLIGALDLAFSTAVYYEWKSKVYEIRPEGILFKRGIFFRREVTYPLNNVESVTLRQGMFGQYFGFGTLRIYDPALQQTIELANILNPDYYKRLVMKRYITEDTETSSRVIFGQ